MSRASYIYIVTSGAGVKYATDRKYMLLAWWIRFGDPHFDVSRVRWDGRVDVIEIESTESQLHGDL